MYFRGKDRTEPRHPGMPGIMIRCYCSPGKVLISDEFWQPTTDGWQLLLQALGKQENKTVRLCRRPARSFTRAPTKKQFGRKNYYAHPLLAQSMGHPPQDGLNPAIPA